MADINIYGTFKSQTGDGKIAYASEVYDVAKGKFQSEINQEGGSSAAYETIDIGDQSDYTGTYPDGYYTISYSGNLYNGINAIWASGKIPVLKMALSTHTSAYSIPLYKAPTDNFDGHDRAKNGNYTIDVQIYSSQQRIITRSVGTYTKPSGGIPKTDLAQAVQNTLDKAENLDTELDETSTNAVQNKVIAKELNDNYAKKDGFYESMGVGTAVNLAGQVERTNDSLYRTSGGTEDIATGTARIEAIKGQTIAWNQIAPPLSDATKYKYPTADTDNFTVVSYSGEVLTFTAYRYYGLALRCNCTHKLLVKFDCKADDDIIIGTGFTDKQNAAAVYIDLKQHNITNNWTTIKTIHTGGNSDCQALVFFARRTDINTTMYVRNVVIIDLTLIYGSGNEPSTPEQFETDYQKWFGKPLTYEPYDKGSLKNVMLDGLKTVGFNQFDEEWEDGAINSTTGENTNNNSTFRTKNFIRVLPNAQYYCNNVGGTGTSTWCLFYDSNKVVIEGHKTGKQQNKNASEIKNSVFFTPDNCKYIRFYTKKDVENLCINLSCSGVKNGTYKPYEENTISIPTTTMTGKLNGEGESVVIFPDGMNKFDSLYYVGRKTYAVNGGVTRAYQEGDVTSETIVTDGRAYTYVKRETPLVYEVDDFTLPARYKVNDWGTEEQLQVTGANGIAAIISCLYGVNAVDILCNLPKNYISTESMDNFLAALGTAMGGTWTKTWNENDEEYNFSFTANALTNSLTSNQEDI